MHLTRLTLLGLALVGLVLAAWLSGCGSGSAGPPANAAAPSAPPSGAPGSTPITTAKTPAPRPAPPKPVDPVVIIHTTAGDIHIKLLAEKAPATVENFLANYVSRGFYDETIFHHVEPESMLIGGGYTAELAPKPTRTAIFNESRNGLTNTRGMVAMIRDPETPHSATSQFFINLADNPALDYKATDTEEILGYCVFGEVISGMGVVDRIAQGQTVAQGEFQRVPSPAVAIKNVERVLR